MWAHSQALLSVASIIRNQLKKSLSLPLNISAFPTALTAFPAPVLPDLVRRDAFYSYSEPPDLNYCREVWNQLPSGPIAGTYNTNPPPTSRTLKLPIELGDD